MITLIPFSMYKEMFSEFCLAMHQDKIPKVRSHLANDLIKIKAYYDITEEDALLITEIL